MSSPHKITLFGIPFAGGSAAGTYGRWGRLLPASIKMLPLELAGRGRRMQEPFFDNVAATVADLLDKVAPVAAREPYAIYGHSMGTVLGYELIKVLADAGLPEPKAIFFSGRQPPHHIYQRKILHVLDDAEFIEEIKKLGGTPEGFFDMPDLVKAFLPILRCDYRMIELYQQAAPLHVSRADIVYFYSDQDSLVSKPAIYEWERYTHGQLVLKDFQGGHFFINDNAEPICRHIAAWLLPLLAPY